MRGAWIEILMIVCSFARLRSRSPCGERGLKSVSRTPQYGDYSSLPMRGAWIEISAAARNYADAKSLPMRGAWIEILWLARMQDW